MFWLFSYFVLILLICYYTNKTLTFWRTKRVYQDGVWAILNNHRRTLFSKKSLLELLVESYSKFKNYRYVGLYNFGSPFLMVQDPELIKEMLVKNFECFANHRGAIDEDGDPVFSRSLPILKDEKWRAMRATLSPSFTGSKMRGLFTLMDEAAQKYVEFYKDGEPQFSLECKESFTKLTNDIIATCAFGIQVNSLENPENEFYLAAKEATNFGGSWGAIKFMLGTSGAFFRKLLKPSVFTKHVQTYFGDLISSTLKTREEQNIIRPDMIHLLMQARKGLLKHDNVDTHNDSITILEQTQYDRNDKIRLTELTDLDILSQAMIFISAGFETVSTSFSLLTYEIAVNPHVQERLRAEIQNSLNENNGVLTYNSILCMKYLDMVVSESLRKWPIGFVIDRVCTKQFTIPRDKDFHYNESDVTLNPGDAVMVNIIGVHRDPNLYPEPDKFDPERFNDENKKKITPYNYMPFGVGPRHCIAIRFALMEMKTILARLLINFELYPVKKTHIPMKLAKSFNIIAEGGYWVGFKRLDSN